MCALCSRHIRQSEASTSSHWPRLEASKLSLPSMSARVVTTDAPVDFATLLCHHTPSMMYTINWEALQLNLLTASANGHVNQLAHASKVLFWSMDTKLHLSCMWSALMCNRSYLMTGLLL